MAEKKTICFSIPCYNERNNVVPLTEQLLEICDEQLSDYDCTIQFIDNCSTDGTRDLLKGLCTKYPRVRAILNAKNFPLTSGYYGISQAVADATISIPSDFQIPLDTVPKMVYEWENGAKIVCLVKADSEENGLMWHIRQQFYKLSNRYSETEMIRNFSGSGLYDRKFLDICRKIDDPVVSFCAMVSQLGYDIVKMPYTEKKRKSGKSKNHLLSLFTMAIMRFTNASNIGPRYATVGGFVIGFLSAIIGVVYFVLKLLFWYDYPVGTVPIIFGVFFLGGLQLFFIGLIGEYIMKINTRLMRRPLVIEEERFNFTEDVTEKNRDE